MAMYKRLFSLLLTTFFLSLSFNIYSQWTIQSSGTTTHLNDVHFINQNMGWACGEGGIILKTTNGGTTWVSQSTGTTLPIEDIHMLSSTDGWATAPSFSGERILHFNGSSWSIDTTLNAWVLYMNSPSDGWIAYADELYDYDGTSWTYQTTLSHDVYDMHFLSSNSGWAAGQLGRIWYYNGYNWSVQNSSVPYITKCNSI